MSTVHQTWARFSTWASSRMLIAATFTSATLLIIGFAAANCDSTLNGLLLVVPTGISIFIQLRTRSTISESICIHFAVGLLWGFFLGVVYSSCFILLRPHRMGWPDYRIDQPLTFGLCLLEMMALIGLVTAPVLATVSRVARYWLHEEPNVALHDCNVAFHVIGRVAGRLILLATVLAIAIAMFDAIRVVHLRAHVHVLSGSDSRTIVHVLGPADFVRTQPDEVSRWIYCSRFDWDGVRSRWNDAPYLLYWYTRIHPARDEMHDAIIELSLKNSRLISITNSVREDLIGRHPILSF